MEVLGLQAFRDFRTGSDKAGASPLRFVSSCHVEAVCLYTKYFRDLSLVLGEGM